MRILVVDNGGQWTHREWRVLRDLNVDSEIIPNSTPLDKIKADGLVLSGGAPRVGLDQEKMGMCGEYIDKAGVPILGICAGHQFMATHLGGKAGPSKVSEFGKMMITVDDEDELFKGLPTEFVAWESHNDEITELPLDFVALAHSDSCLIQAMKHTSKPLFGLQFHPEVEHTDNGYEMFQAFIDICQAHKKE
ncbi:MAG: GMP synthase subunit A [Candidatus Thermoplasmatota archaeon]|nr:GMP synthase subunit A [Candidatus Thermoplasmatota archaeon]